MYKYGRNYENLNKCIFPGVGQFNIPIIKPTHYEGCHEFVGFNYAKGCKDKDDKGIHFFIDDYQFNRVWTNIDKYLPLFSKFKYIMSPDFSTYSNFPKAIQIYNHYRKHWIGAYLQQNGMSVIPSISWSDYESYKWCFDGEPVKSVVAVSSVGTQQGDDAKKLFLEGYREMVRKLNPAQIIFYGKIPEECSGNIIPIEAFHEKFRIIEEIIGNNYC